MFAFTKYTLEMVADRFNASIPALLRLTKDLRIPIWAELENVESSLYGSWTPEWTFHKSVELQLSDSTLKEIARAQDNTIKESLICGSVAAGEELLNVRPCCRNNNNEVASFLLQCLAKITLTPVDLLIHACDFPKITQALIAEGFQDKHTITTTKTTAAPAPENDEYTIKGDEGAAGHLTNKCGHPITSVTIARWRKCKGALRYALPCKPVQHGDNKQFNYKPSDLEEYYDANKEEKKKNRSKPRQKKNRFDG